MKIKSKVKAGWVPSPFEVDVAFEDWWLCPKGSKPWIDFDYA